ncbi:MAG: lytic transglycosylase F [Gammaproteobacteria bacterium]|nr:lytic transglycosylase F [Gammaproteobacteria bacterium]
MREGKITTRHLTGLGGFLLSASLLLLTLQPTTLLADPSIIEAVVNQRFTDDLAAMRKRRQIRALVAYSRTDFAIRPDGKAVGLQVEMLAEYEKRLNKGIKRAVERTRVILIPTTFDRLIPDLLEGKGDIAAALLTMTPERKKRVAFATGAAMEVSELLVQHKKAKPVTTLDQLAGREIVVLRNSSYAEHLRALNRDFAERGLEPIRITEAESQLHSEDILELVNSGAVEMTVVDDYKARIWAKVLPDIRVVESVPVSQGNTLGWAVRKNNPKLHASLNSFARKVRKGSLLGNILFKRYYDDPEWISNPLADAERSRFRQVVAVFSIYADTYGFDVLATTAQAYQESRLDQNRRSHRGAIGIMQMLPSTAADPNVGIDDIRSLENNIHAGVKYLAFLRDRYFSEPGISPKDRLAFSWAAYNAGPANVRRMRSKASKMGLDPDSWFGQVELAAARTVGNETVDYVRNVFKYYVAYALVRDQLLATTQAALSD